MKQTVLFLLLIAAISVNAQVEFKIVTGPSIREYQQLASYSKDGYILKYTGYDIAKRYKGKFVKYNTDNKMGLQKEFEISNKLKPFPYGEILLQGDKALWLTGGTGRGQEAESSTLLLSHAYATGFTVQPFDLKTMQPGTPAVAMDVWGATKEKYPETSILRSLEGKRLAMIGNPYNVYTTMKFQLHDETGKVLFTKDYSVPFLKKWDSWYGQNLAENGDFTFFARNEKENFFYITRIGADDQKLYSKKIEMSGKKVFSFGCKAKDGNLVLKYTYQTGDEGETEGIVVDTYSPTFELITHADYKFPETILARAAATKKSNPKAKYSMRLKDMETGGYLAIIYEDGQRQTGPQKWDDTQNNLFCVGLSDKFEVLYQYDVHHVDEKSNWCIYRPYGNYIEGDNVYMFHAGTDDKVKNTKDEFELYCTYWQHNKTKPQTIKVERPYPDLNLSMGWYHTMDKNKLLIRGEGNGGKTYTTMQIISK